jgi:hypothetical protein
MASPTKLSLELRNMMQAWADQEEQERDLEARQRLQQQQQAGK